MNDGLLLHAPSYLQQISAARRRKPGKTLAKMAQRDSIARPGSPESTGRGL
jgi:hypothetical protein